MTQRSPRVRVIGHGNQLRLRTLGDWEAHPIEALRKCCRAETALEKAIGGNGQQGTKGKHSRTEIGDALGVTKQTAWQRFSSGLRHPTTGEEIDSEGEPDASPVASSRRGLPRASPRRHRAGAGTCEDLSTTSVSASA